MTVAVHRLSLAVVVSFLSVAVASAEALAPNWPRHIIGTGNGADGVDASDIDNDGDTDIVVPWEKGGALNVYFNPGGKPTEPWPFVDARGGVDVTGIEDAIFADFDNDGQIDALVSCIEDEDSFFAGTHSRVLIHWIMDPQEMASSSAWRGVPVTQEPALYLRAKVGRLAADGRPAILVGTKEKHGYPGKMLLFQVSPGARLSALSQWTRHDLGSLYRINNLELIDMDGDGDNDILYSDGPGLAWLRNPGVPMSLPWQKISIGSPGPQFAICDLDSDGVLDIIASYNADPTVAAVWYKRTDKTGESWRGFSILPEGGVPMTSGVDEYTPKGVACADMDLDGKQDIVFTASGTGTNVYFVSYRGASPEYSGTWNRVLISEESTAKYDNLVLVDIDKDGDSDVVTTEEKQGDERRGLGALWYENPTR